MDNRLMAGASYLEQALAETLGMSRTPVREAALRLESEGFVTIRPRLGIYIRPISRTDMIEIYALLTELEPYATRLLAERSLTSEEQAELRAPVKAMERYLAQGARQDWAQADREFHETLIRLTGNARLMRFVATLWDQVHRTRATTVAARQDLERSNEDHRAVVALIIAGKGAEAEALHRQHRDRANAGLLCLLDDAGDEL